VRAFRKPRALSRGDAIAIVAPSGPFDRESFDAGLALLAERYQPRFDPGLFSRHRYLAGDDQRRLDELLRALRDPEIRAVFCARGGYGAMRLLPRLTAATADDAERPTGSWGSTASDRASAGIDKPLVGFSDITALHAWVQNQELVSFHGPVVTQISRLPAASRERMFSVLESTATPPAPLTATTTYVGGVTEGRLVGGNFAMLTQLIGTPFLPPLDGAILLLEDVGERPYKLDRMWTQLELAGVFRGVRGIALGTFTACEEKDAQYTSGEVLRDLAQATGLPCAAGFPIGHGDENETVPLGAHVKLDADRRRLEFLEAAVG
jgi:muramoyltetrapeptide carboxypeptidase